MISKNFSVFFLPRVLLSAVVLVMWANSAAQQAPESPSNPPLWEIGGLMLGVAQQAYPGANQHVNVALATPYLIYRGEFFRIDRNSAGLRAIKTSSWELDLGFSGSLGGGSTAIKARQGMPSLGTLIEAGPRVKWTITDVSNWGHWRAELPIRAVLDLSDRAAHKGWSTEPKLVFDGQPIGGWRYSASVSAVVADRAFASTVYEVTSAQAMAGRAAYTAKSGLMATRLSATVSRPLTPDWTLFGVARLDTVSGAANESSPLVRKKTGSSIGVGLVYTWMRSERRASD